MVPKQRIKVMEAAAQDASATKSSRKLMIVNNYIIEETENIKNGRKVNYQLLRKAVNTLNSSPSGYWVNSLDKLYKTLAIDSSRSQEKQKLVEAIDFSNRWTPEGRKMNQQWNKWRTYGRQMERLYEDVGGIDSIDRPICVVVMNPSNSVRCLTIGKLIETIEGYYGLDSALSLFPLIEDLLDEARSKLGYFTSLKEGLAVCGPDERHGLSKVTADSFTESHTTSGPANSWMELSPNDEIKIREDCQKATLVNLLGADVDLEDSAYKDAVTRTKENAKKQMGNCELMGKVAGLKKRNPLIRLVQGTKKDKDDFGGLEENAREIAFGAFVGALSEMAEASANRFVPGTTIGGAAGSAAFGAVAGAGITGAIFTFYDAMAEFFSEGGRGRDFGLGQGDRVNGVRDLDLYDNSYEYRRGWNLRDDGQCKDYPDQCEQKITVKQPTDKQPTEGDDTSTKWTECLEGPFGEECHEVHVTPIIVSTPDETDNDNGSGSTNPNSDNTTQCRLDVECTSCKEMEAGWKAIEERCDKSNWKEPVCTQILGMQEGCFAADQTVIYPDPETSKEPVCVAELTTQELIQLTNKRKCEIEGMVAAYNPEIDNYGCREMRFDDSLIEKKRQEEMCKLIYVDPSNAGANGLPVCFGGNVIQDGKALINKPIVFFDSPNAVPYFSGSIPH